MSKQLVYATGICICIYSVPCLGYDPLSALFDLEKSHFVDIESSHEGRVIPLLISLPKKKGPLPVTLFSHGLGGSRTGCEYIRTYWTERGYATIFLQHPGSDESLVHGLSSIQALRNLRSAATRKKLNLRVGDVTDVLDAIATWNSDKRSPFYCRLNINKMGLAGHSMGARTAQLIIGQQGWLGTTKKDMRIRAAVVMSPSSPSLRSAKSAFGSVATPCLLLTRTRDSVPLLSDQSVDSRRAVFPALPSGNAYELVLHNATHSAFTEKSRKHEPPHNPKHHRSIETITTASWDAYLQSNKEAKMAQRGRSKKRDRPRGHLADKLNSEPTSAETMTRSLGDAFSPHSFPIFCRRLGDRTTDIITYGKCHIKILIWIFMVKKMVPSTELI